MKRSALLALFLALVSVVAACGAGRSSTAAAGPSTAATEDPPASSASSATASTTTIANTSPTDRPPHFDTPEAAMTYLAAAWNSNDLVSLRHVTNPDARQQLDQMHAEATSLRLDHCDANPAGDYTCHFQHDYPAGYSVPPDALGEAVFLVGPAETPGWYMTVFQGCS
jgi:hypothetical protein